MAALLPIAIFMGGVVVMHLTKDVAIDEVEKMACSRTVYFLIINVLQWVCLIDEGLSPGVFSTNLCLDIDGAELCSDCPKQPQVLHVRTCNSSSQHWWDSS